MFESAIREVKRKYVKANQLPKTGTQVLMDIQGMTMVVLDKSNGNLSWRLSPECFSTWKRYTRIYSWVMRFISNCHVNKEHRMKGELSLYEIRDTEKLIIKNIQREVFYNEYVALQKRKQLPIDSKLLGLCPKLDEDRIMRSDSQLQYAEFLPYDVRYPILLPRKHWVTLFYCHENIG